MAELRDRAQAVPPLDWGDSTAWQSSKNEPQGGATSCQRRLHLLAKLGDRAQVVPPPDSGGSTAWQSLETELLGGATADPSGATAGLEIWVRMG